MNETWDVECSGLSEVEAREAAAVLTADGFQAAPVDPRLWLTWRLDADSVLALAPALREALETVKSEHTRNSLRSLLEDCDDWLTR